MHEYDKLFNQVRGTYVYIMVDPRRSDGLDWGREGQFSTFIKPVMLIMIIVLFLFLLVTVTDFDIGMEEDVQQVDLQTEASKNFQKLANCLRAEGTVSQKLSIPHLIDYEQTYLHREPECGEDFRYGYETTVQEDFVRGQQYMNPRVDLVFLVDMSTSIVGDPNEPGDEELQRLCAAQDDIIEELERRGFNVEFTVYGLTPQLSEEISDGELDTILRTTCIDDELEEEPVGHYEDWANGVTWAAEEYNWREGATRLAFPITDECPAEVGPLVGWEGWYRSGGQWMNQPIIIPCDENREDNPGRAVHMAETEEAIETATENRVTTFPILGDPRSVTDRDYVPAGVEPWDDHIEYAAMLAEGTGGEYFLAEEEDIEERIIDIVIDNVFIPLHPETTCVIPSQDTWGREAELAITTQADLGSEEEWEELCESVDTIEAGLQQRGWVVDTTVYAPGQPGTPDDGDGTPMSLPDGDGNYDHDGNVPACVDEVTAWEGSNLDSFDPSRDYGISAWGVASKWILENHPWDESLDKRALVSVGNKAPTGGTGDDAFRADEAITGGDDIVENIVSLGNENDVQVSTVTDGDWGTRTTSQYGDQTENDIREAMEDVADGTGGVFREYSEVGDVPNSIMDGVAEDPGEVCTNQDYRFGQREGSEGRSLNEEYTLSFPVTLERTGDYTTHGTMNIEIRDGDLEQLASTVNNLVRDGQERETETSTALWLNVGQEMYGEETEIERPNRTTYRMVNAETGDPTVEVDTDLVIGVNGYEVFDSDEFERSVIDFTDESNQFTGYEGATLQVIATNQRHPDMYLDSLAVECVDPECDEEQTILDETIDTTDGDEEYDERGRLGAFYHEFTELEIGGTAETDEAAICIATPGDDSCSVIRADNIEEFTLDAGRHLLEISYDPDTDTVSIND